MKRDNTTERKGVSVLVKSVIAAQTVLIIFFGWFMYQEYTFNTYFKAYVDGFMATNGLLVLGLASVTVFVSTASITYVRLRSTRRKVEEHKGSTDAKKMDRNIRPSQRLDSSTEQHLIDMLRRNVTVGQNPQPAEAASPAQASTVPPPLPPPLQQTQAPEPSPLPLPNTTGSTIITGLPILRRVKPLDQN